MCSHSASPSSNFPKCKKFQPCLGNVRMKTRFRNAGKLRRLNEFCFLITFLLQGWWLCLSFTLSLPVRKLPQITCMATFFQISGNDHQTLWNFRLYCRKLWSILAVEVLCATMLYQFLHFQHMVAVLLYNASIEIRNITFVMWVCKLHWGGFWEAQALTFISGLNTSPV